MRHLPFGRCRIFAPYRLLIFLFRQELQSCHNRISVFVIADVQYAAILFCKSTHFHQAKAVVGSIVLGRQEFSVFIGAQGSAVGVLAADGKILPANLHRAENFSLLCLRGCLQGVVQHIEKKAAQVILSDL